MRNFKEEYQRWLDSPALSEAEWQELKAIENDEKEIESRFFEPLSFGTAGLRGTLATGLRNMNIHVVRHATQAFANVIKAEGEEAVARGISIAYDCRINSDVFAREAACVMAANGIKSLLTESLRPTPELSFMVIKYGTIAGINITASHNPKEYNGYKVYWEDGAQLPPKHADAVAAEMNRIDIFNDVKVANYEEAVASGMIQIMGKETDEAFLECALGQVIYQEEIDKAADVKIVFTPFHGTGHILVPEALKRAGFKNIYPVAEQMVIDGNFPTVASPNPENPEGFYLGVELADKVGSDLIIGTDPDADRIGVMVRGEDGKFLPITGNQMGALLLDYIITARKATGTMPENPAALKSLVSSEMSRVIAEANGVYMAETFTGFKFLAEKINQFIAEGSHNFILAFEESYGYMVGDYVRDKDAVTAAVIIAEMAAYYYNRGMNLKQALDALYVKYGCFAEKTINLVMPGLDGLKNMKLLMEDLRKTPLTEIGGTKVVRIRDYLDGSIYVTGLGKVETMDMKDSNILYFELEDGTSFIVRPSGTEPKVKVYIMTRAESMDEAWGKIATYGDFAQTLKR